MITKKLIKPISKYGIANIDLDNYYTKPQIDSKVDTINGEIETIRNDLGDLGNEVNTNTNSITTINNSIPNFLVKNATNTISTTKLLSTTNRDNTVFEINNGAEKKMLFDFIQSSGGYRNWNHLIFRVKLGNSNYANIFDAYSKNTGEGLWINVENNKVNFDNPTKITNIATPTNNNDCANKQYVDNSITPLTSEITTIQQEQTTQNQQIATKQDILTAGNNITIENNVISSNINLDNYYTKTEIDTKLEWEVVDSTTITRENQQTIIPLNGKRFIHLQGRFTQYSTATGSWNNFTPFTLDTQNYNYMVRFPIYDWNTQTLRASIECVIDNGNLILNAYNTSNQRTSYYLWGDVLVK